MQGSYDDALLRGLRRGEYDFVVSELPSAEIAQDLDLLPLSVDDLRVCCRKGHPLARRQELKLGALARFPWAMPPRSTIAV